MRAHHASASLLILCIVSGCNTQHPPIKSAFQALTFETSQPEGPILRHNEVMSIASLIPVVVPGSSMHFSDPRDPTTMVGIHPGSQTFVLTATFGETGASPTTYSNQIDPKLLALRQRILEYQTAQLEFVNAANLIIAKGVSELSEIDRKENPAWKHTATAHLGKIFEEYAEKMTTHRSRVLAAEQKLVAEIDQYGLIVTRWSALQDTAYTGVVGGTIDGSARASAAQGGYWILQGLRLRFLIIGSDITRIGQSPRGSSTGASIDRKVARFLQAISVSTFIVQAQQSLWASESSELVAARLHLQLGLNTLSQLAGSLGSISMAASLLDAAQSDLDLGGARQLQLSNAGALAGPKWSTENYDWDKPLGELTKTSSGWLTVLVQNAAVSHGGTDLLSLLAKLRESGLDQAAACHNEPAHH